MQKTAYELRISDWSSDVCSVDLCIAARSDQFTGHFAGHGIHATETRVWIASHHRLLQRRCSPVRSTFAAFWQRCADCHFVRAAKELDRDVAKRSEEHTSELPSLMHTSYAVLRLTTKKRKTTRHTQ